MSRIHEALQRAAEQATTSDVVPEPPATQEPMGKEVSELSREPFPVEIGGARRKRHAPEPAPAAPDPQPRAYEADTDEPREEPVRKTLFDRIDARLAEKVVVDANMSAVSREQYRRLAGVLHDAQGNNGIRVVMIASAVPGEGKTLTATNVSLTLSDSYRRRVMLIDADLRRPSLHQVFRLNTAAGLIDGLESPSDVKLVLRQVSPYLSVLPAGRPTSDPMAGLTSERMKRLIDEAKETFDWVIIDTPPLMLLPDAHLLAALVDCAVLVIKANSTPHDLVRRTAEIIGRKRVIGVVLNQAESNAHPAYDGYGGYGGYYRRYYLTDKTTKKS
jgi:capsular exopolysaccharide synthesis family protein